MSKPATPTRWVTAAVLQALAAGNVRRNGDRFTAGWLAERTVATLAPDQRVHATSRLCALHFVTHKVELLTDERCDVYTLTAEGAAAVQEAASGGQRKSGPKGSRAPNPLQPDSFTARLWRLVRVRKMLTAREAAETLCDAGTTPEADIRRAQETARRTMRRWCDAGALAESVRRVAVEGASRQSNGDKRFVLVVDSPEPPRWRPAEKARKAAAIATASPTRQAAQQPAGAAR